MSFESSNSNSYYSDSGNYCSTCSMNTTPSRRGLSDAGPTVTDMNPELKRDVDERFVDDKLGVKEFVHRVWGIEEHAINTILGSAESFSSELFKDLVDKYRNAANEREQKTYGLFSNLAEYLSDRLQTLFPKLTFINCLCSRRGEMVIDSGCNKRKPDTIVVSKGCQGKFDWEHILVPFEFKTRDKRARHQKSLLSMSYTAGSPTLSKILVSPGNGQAGQSFDDGLPFAQPIYPGVSSSNARPNSSCTLPAVENNDDKSITKQASDQSTTYTSKSQIDKKSKGNRSVILSGNASPASPATGGSKKVNINNEIRSQLLRSPNRGLFSTASANKRQAEDSTAPPSKRRKIHATGEQLQLARYALECMAASSRHYVAGVFINRFDISLWYYDRAVVARTVNFNFQLQPEMLAVVLYALFTCDPRRAGFNPFIIPVSHPCPANIEQLFEAPTSTSQSEDDQIVIIPNDGPVKQYKITGKRLFANRCLVGRGTVVFPVQEIEEDGISNKLRVAKVSWPDAKRLKEAVVINKLRNAISEMARHLPNVTSFLDMTAGQLHLPSCSLKINGVEDLERRLHVMVMDRYKALWDVNSVEEFQEVFVDCVECHYAAYKRGRVLHRDLSINNLMCDLDEKDEQCIGILSDWDLASWIDEANDVITSNLKHRTGTIPFMSINLLRASPPPHRYCHDLESFFYILVWAAVHFDLKKHKCNPQHPRFKNWNNPDLMLAAQPKVNFLVFASEVGEYVSKPFRSLFETWIGSLRSLFRNAYLGKELDIESSAVDNAITLKRLEEIVTFESFMTAIGRKPRYIPVTRQ